MINTRLKFKKYNYEDLSVLDEGMDIELPFRLNIGDEIPDDFLIEISEEKTEAIFNYYEKLTALDRYQITIKVEKIILQYEEENIPYIWAYCGITEIFR